MVVLIHGEDDATIPPSHSEALFEAARGPHGLWLVPGAKHAAIFNRYPDDYELRVDSFLARAFGSAQGGPARGPLTAAPGGPEPDPTGGPRR